MSDLRDQLEATLSGTYRLDRELTGGGMSRVFLADETRLGRKVVVKVLSPDLAAGISAERFQREIKLAASLQQANIVPVLSAGESNGLAYYTMPFVEGENLRARIRSAGPLPIRDVVSILRDVARALAYAHEKGIVHRDIKPDNVLLSRGAAVVTDFGIAKALEGSRVEGRASSDRISTPDAKRSALTALGTTVGTPAYMAPEQAAGDPATDHRADFYAFGCMAYELLTGEPPFTERTPHRLLTAHMTETPAPLLSKRPDAPPALAAMVMRCLEKDPAHRPQSADDVLSVLDAITSGEGQPAMPEILLGGPGMLRKVLALYALAFVVVAVLAKAAIVAVGLPDWVFPGALIVMALGLPMILITSYTQRVMRRIAAMTPQYTPGGSPSLARHGTMATIAVKASPHLSWRRTIAGGAWALSAFVLLIGVFMLLRALGIGPAGSLLARGALARNEPLLVADFSVKTSADSALSGVVAEAVRAGLGESNVISILPTSTIRAALGRMQKPATSRLDPALAREVAQRAGVKALVAGDVTPLGAGFVVTARLLNAETGDELASFQETADAPKDLIATIGKLTRDMRGRIGESLRNVHATQPLEDVTTTSLEALRKYSAGARAIDDADYKSGAALLKEAVQTDSTFASAWRKLAVAYNNARMPRDLVSDAATHAYRARDHLSERERYETEAFYYEVGPEADRGKAAEAYEQLLRFDPHNMVGGNNLAGIYMSRRQYARAESLYRAVYVHGDSSAVTMGNLLSAAYMTGKPAEAQRILDEEVKRFGPMAGGINADGAELAYLRGQLDSAQMMLEARAAQPNPAIRGGAHQFLSGVYMIHGQIAPAEREWTAMLQAQAQRGAAFDTLAEAMRFAFIDGWMREQPAKAAQELDAALARTPLRSRPLVRRPYFNIASDYAQYGRPDKARAIIAQVDAEVKDAAWLRQTRPGRDGALAEIALAEKHPLEAVKYFHAADQREDGPVGCEICTYGDLARAFDQAGVADSAIYYFERYFSTPFMGRLFPRMDGTYAAGAHKRLGELYEAKGDTAKAVAHYEKFVELWKNADPDLQPKVREVRARLSRLGAAERR